MDFSRFISGLANRSGRLLQPAKRRDVTSVTPYQAFSVDQETQPLAWVLADQRQGTANQCLGVADAFGGAYEVKEIGHSALAVLPNIFLGSSLAGLQSGSASGILPPWPDLVISGGRRTAPIARHIKVEAARTGGRYCFLAHLMHPGPGAGAGNFDLIAVPRHDRPRTSPGNISNLFPITGAPHRVNEAALAEARTRWREMFENLARPLVGLLLGGATRRKPFREAQAVELGASAGTLTAAAGGSLVITASPRTGDTVQHVAAAAAGGAPPAHVHHWSATGDNPYLGILALADILVVTGDSVTMCSEACATGKPVYIFAPPEFSVAKHVRFQADLFAGGYARSLAGSLEVWEHPPLNASAEIAAEIHRRMEQRGR